MGKNDERKIKTSAKSSEIKINYWTLKCKNGFRITTLKPTGKELLIATDGIELPNQYDEKNKILDIVGVLPKFSKGLFLENILLDLKFETLKTNGGIILNKKIPSVTTIEFYNTPYLDTDEKISKYRKTFSELISKFVNLQKISLSHYFFEIVKDVIVENKNRLKTLIIRQSENISFNYESLLDICTDVVYVINKLEIVKIDNIEINDRVKYKYSGIEYNNFSEIKNIEEVVEKIEN